MKSALLIVAGAVAWGLITGTIGYHVHSYVTSADAIRRPADPRVFAANLKTAIDGDAKATHLAKKVLAVIDGPESHRRTLVLSAMERHAAAHLGESVDKIDWSKVDWAVVLYGILRVLILLLPLL
jgi:hypothetical protein